MTLYEWKKITLDRDSAGRLHSPGKLEAVEHLLDGMFYGCRSGTPARPGSILINALIK